MQRRQLLLGLLILSHLAIAGCDRADEGTQSGGIKIACVGDSITFGLGLKNRKEECYPNQLAQRLGDGFKVRNFGISGTTLLKQGDHPYWTTKQYRDSIDWQPEIVVIKLGSNDTKPRNWKHREQFATDLKTMIAAYRLLPSHPEVFLCLPTPAFPERWGIRDSVIEEELIPMIREVANEQDCSLIDLYAALDGKKELFPDKVHPNKEGAALIAKIVAAAVQKAPEPLQNAGSDTEKKGSGGRQDSLN